MSDDHDRATYRERRLAKADRYEEWAIEHGDKAASMASRAATIRAQADHAIYDDDPDALDRLHAKLADLEAQRTGIREYNKTCRRGTPDVSLLHPVQAKELDTITARIAAVLTHITRPDGSLAPYIAANLGGVITTTRKRIAKLEAQA